MIISVILIIVGFALLIKGADFLVDGASSIAQKFHIPEIIIGLTVVSIGTSMPELVVSVNSALQGHSDIAVGNVIGSNIANVMLILGMCAVMKPLEFKRETRIIEIPITIAATVMLFIMSHTAHAGIDNMIGRAEGGILLGCCILFIIYNIVMAKKGEAFDAEEGLDEREVEITILPNWKAVLFIIVGIIGLKFGGDLVVEHAVNIATLCGISETLISLTIVAISTSLPELVTSVTATRKGEIDMAIGNIVGSNIFNIVLIIGTSALISPILYDISYNTDMLVSLVSVILLAITPYIGHKNHLGRIQGGLYVGSYLAYMIWLVCTNVM